MEMNHLNEFLDMTWFRCGGATAVTSEDAEKDRKALIAAQEKIAAGLWDFPFSFNIALEDKNIERNRVNAENLLSLYKKEILTGIDKLDEHLRPMAKLDWIVVFYRALDKISKMRASALDRDAAEFAAALALSSKFDEAVSDYYMFEERIPASRRMPAFDAWIEQVRKELVVPQNSFWRHADRFGRITGAIRTGIGIAVLGAVIFCIGSISTGRGPVASALGIHHPHLVAAEDLTDLGAYEPVAIADYNASSILLSKSEKKPV